MFARKSLIKVSKSFICNNVIISYGVKILIYTFPPKGIALVSLFLSFIFNLVENQKRYKNQRNQCAAVRRKWFPAHLTFICSKLTIETLENGSKYVLS